MDNICHTLVGAALAQTGLKRRTGLGAATLMIGANFPDIDVLSIAFGRATEFRRGWTHGVLALVVLPFVLTGIMIAWDRYSRRSRQVERAPVVPRELVLLSAVSILTHPTLDWMNSYGMRWLMPFDGKWFYGDSLFIVDPWLLLVLGPGVWVSRRRERASRGDAWRPARVGLGVAGAYVITMLGLQNTAERIVRSDLAGSGWLSHTLMVSASPANPIRWTVYADDGTRYWKGAVSLAPGVTRRLIFDEVPIEKHADDPAAIAAARSEKGRRFLNWARLPYYQVERGAGVTRVEIIDARYGASADVAVD